MGGITVGFVKLLLTGGIVENTTGAQAPVNAEVVVVVVVGVDHAFQFEELLTYV